VKPRQKRASSPQGRQAGEVGAIVVRAKKPNDAGVRLLTIGTFTAKRRMFGSLRMKPGPRCMHFHKFDDGAAYGLSWRSRRRTASTSRTRE
jgi:hypothetical protein